MKDKLIQIISNASNRYGDLLIECLDKYNVNGLVELSEEQLKEFIKERIENDKN